MTRARKFFLFIFPMVVVTVGLSGCDGSAKSPAPSGKKASAPKSQKSGENNTANKKTSEPSKGNAKAVGWGNLTGRFVFDGTAPAPAELSVDKNKVECCAGGCPKDESLLVDSEGGIANVVVYVRTKRGSTLAVHPDYEASANSKVRFDNKGCAFDPHVLVMRTSQTLDLHNSDTVGHNSNVVPLKNEGFNPLIPAGDSVEHKFEKAETIPVSVNCSIHNWMKGYIVLREDPYATVSGKDGRFTIKNLPAGIELEFQVWHEKSGYVKTVSIAGTETDKRGRFKMTIKADDDNDLGTVKIGASLFEKN